MSPPAPPVAAVRVAVRQMLAPVRDELVIVACSGGPDSLALAAATAFVAPRLGVRAGLVTVDHQLQPGSAERAKAVAAWAAGAGLDPVEIATVDVAGRPGGPEAAARQARYAALTESANRLGAVAVLLGHTRDDQAETVLLALARGAGPRGLAGMPPSRTVNGVTLLRPLLDVSRDDTVAACAALGLIPWTDPHNIDPSYARSRVRAAALPALVAALGPAVIDNLARTARLLAADTAALDALAETALDAARLDGAGLAATGVAATGVADAGVAATGVASATAEGAAAEGAAAEGAAAEGAAGEGARVEDGPVGGALSVPVLRDLPEAVRTRVLHAWARQLGAPGGALAHAHVTALDALITHWHGQGPVHLPAGITITRRSDTLHPTHP